MMVTEQPGWNTVPLRSLCLETTMIDPTRTPARIFEYVDVSAVSNELWKIVNSTRLTGATAPSRARKLVRAQDIIFATVRPSLKRIALVPQDLDGQVVSTAFCVLRADPIKTDPRFIYYSLLTEDFVSQVSGLERGASYPAVTDKDVLGQEIAVPPLPEQRAIATVLSKIQAAVEVQEKIVGTLKELKAATMAKLFREGLQGEPLKQTDIGEIPESWEVAPLGELCGVFSGFAFKSAEYGKRGIPLIKIGNLQDGTVIITDENDCISEERLKDPNLARFILRPGEVLLALTGATTGKLAVVPQSLAVSFLNQRVGKIQPHSDDIDINFCYYLAQQSYFQNTIQQGILKSAQGNVSPSAIEAIPVPRPSQCEQHQIGQFIGGIDERLQLAVGKRDALRSIFSSMLHLLMTGQVRVGNLKILRDNIPETSGAKINKGAAQWSS